ncbi:dihydrodipicolinate synthase family protein [soil metagenome]
MKGVFNILMTPFDEQGAVDFASLTALVDFQLQAGVAGLTIVAILGEGQKLTDDEWNAVVSAVLKQVDGRIPVVVTVSHNSTRIAVERAKWSANLGATAVMAAPPTNLRNLDSVADFYRVLGSGSPVPIVVQDEPASTGVIMPASFLASTGHPLIKLEEPPVPQKISRILERNPDAQIFGGLGGQYFLEELERGAVGTMTGFALTEILVSIYNDFTAGKHDQARDTFYKYIPLIRYEGQLGVGLAIRKEILNRRGVIKCAEVRSPGVRLDEQGKSEVARLLAYLNVETVSN